MIRRAWTGANSLFFSVLHGEADAVPNGSAIEVSGRAFRVITLVRWYLQGMALLVLGGGTVGLLDSGRVPESAILGLATIAVTGALWLGSAAPLHRFFLQDVGRLAGIVDGRVEEWASRNDGEKKCPGTVRVTGPPASRRGRGPGDGGHRG